MKRYFLDTEFIERGRQFPIELISVALICQDGRSYYAESSEFDPAHANQWVCDNVLSKLLFDDLRRKAIRQIAAEIREFVTADGQRPEFWGYYADYDWVVFCQMFGAMVDLPKGFPMYCRDLKQWCDDLGNPELPKCDGEHNALTDARWNLRVFEFLMAREGALIGNAVTDAINEYSFTVASEAHRRICFDRRAGE
jgi:hypothetical protein